MGKCDIQSSLLAYDDLEYLIFVECFPLLDVLVEEIASLSAAPLVKGFG